MVNALENSTLELVESDSGVQLLESTDKVIQLVENTSTGVCELVLDSSTSTVLVETKNKALELIEAPPNELLCEILGANPAPDTAFIEKRLDITFSRSGVKVPCAGTLYLKHEGVSTSLLPWRAHTSLQFLSAIIQVDTPDTNYSYTVDFLNQLDNTVLGTLSLAAGDTVESLFFTSGTITPATPLAVRIQRSTSTSTEKSAFSFISVQLYLRER